MIIRRKKNGFTLIELMVAVLLTGILASMGISSYMTHNIRKQVSEGFKLAGGIQTAISQYYVRGWGMPADMNALKLPQASGQYVSSITQEKGVITITYGNNAMSRLTGGKVTLKGTDNGNGNVLWTCTPDGTIITKEYVPISCV